MSYETEKAKLRRWHECEYDKIMAECEGKRAEYLGRSELSTIMLKPLTEEFNCRILALRDKYGLPSTKAEQK